MPTFSTLTCRRHINKNSCQVETRLKVKKLLFNIAGVFFQQGKSRVNNKKADKNSNTLYYHMQTVRLL